MRYAIARHKKETEREIFRVYVSDTLRNISENIAVVSVKNGGEGKYINTRYFDLLHPKPVDERGADEIIESIKAKLRNGAS